MSSFKVDTDAFTKAIDEYTKELENLKDIKDSISKTLVILKTDGWNSKAGEACMNKFDGKWANEIDKYIVLVSHLTNVLAEAKAPFDDLVKVAESLQTIG